MAAALLRPSPAVDGQGERRRDSGVAGRTGRALDWWRLGPRAGVRSPRRAGRERRPRLLARRGRVRRLLLSRAPPPLRAGAGGDDGVRGVLRAGGGAHHARGAQFLRRSQGGADRTFDAEAGQRQHHSRRAGFGAWPASRAAHLLQPRRTDRRRHEGPGRPAAATARGAHRARRRHARGVRGARRALDLLRNRSGHRRHRTRPRSLQLPRRRPRPGRHRARRRPAVAGRGPRRDVRASGARRVQLRRRAGAPADPRGALAVCAKACARGPAGVSPVKPVPVTGAGRRGGRSPGGPDRHPRFWRRDSRRGGRGDLPLGLGRAGPRGAEISRRSAATRGWTPLPREGQGWSDDASSLWSAFGLADAIRH